MPGSSVCRNRAATPATRSATRGIRKGRSLVRSMGWMSGDAAPERVSIVDELAGAGVLSVPVALHILVLDKGRVRVPDGSLVGDRRRVPVDKHRVNLPLRFAIR